MNLVILMGRTTKDIELRYTQNSLAVARFTLAVDRPGKNNEEKQTDFVQCVCFGKTAENLSKHISKGRRIAVEGRIQTGSYDKQDGSKAYTTDIVVNRFYFADSKPGEQAQEVSQQGPEPQDDFYNSFDDNEDDLPF